MGKSDFVTVTPITIAFPVRKPFLQCPVLSARLGLGFRRFVQFSRGTRTPYNLR